MICFCVHILPNNSTGSHNFLVGKTHLFQFHIKFINNTVFIDKLICFKLNIQLEKKKQIHLHTSQTYECLC